MKTLYVLGYPGAGKSSAVASALRLAEVSFRTTVRDPVPHARYIGASGDEVWEIGKQRDAFSGTDALAMNIQPRAIRWVKALATEGSVAPTLLVGEGDRLATNGFLDACSGLLVAHLSLPYETARHRSIQRAMRLGRKQQNEAWVRGRCSKVDRLASEYPCVSINAELDAPTVAALLARIMTQLLSP